MKKILFTTLLLAVASLGLAFPQGKDYKATVAATPVSKIPETPVSKTSTALVSKTPAALASKALATPATTPDTTPATTPKSPLLSTLASPDAIAAGLDISKECGAAILTIVTSPEFLKCIPVSAFLPLIPIVSDPNFLKNIKSDPAGTFKKVEQPFVQFSTGFCPAPKCSDKGVSGAVKTLSDGCRAELKNNPTIQLVFGLMVFYSPLHDTVCFKSDKSKKFCWDESLQTIFSLPKSPIKIIDGGLIDSVAVADPFKLCTKCNKDIVNTFENFLKNNDPAKQILAGFGVTDKELQLAFVGIAVKCGIDFEDGKVPDKP